MSRKKIPQRMLMRQKRESGKKGKKKLNNKLHIFKQLCKS